MTDHRTETLAFLADQASYWASYHNHKEISAWAVIGALILLSGQALLVLRTWENPTLEARLLATGLLVVVGLLAIRFLEVQAPSGDGQLRFTPQPSPFDYVLSSKPQCGCR